MSAPTLFRSTPLSFAPDIDQKTSQQLSRIHTFSLAETPQSTGSLLLAGLHILHFRYTSLERAVAGFWNGGKKIGVSLCVDGNTTLSNVHKDASSSILTAPHLVDSTPLVVNVVERDADIFGELPPNVHMVWHVRQGPTLPSCHILYNASLYSTTGVQSLAQNLLDTINTIIHKPHITVEDVSFTHIGYQLQHSNIPVGLPPAPTYSHTNLVDAFTETAATFSASVALIDTNSSFTYKELDVLSSALAEKILSFGPGSDFIACCVPPSPLAIVTILAIIKCGAAYVPLDIRLPPARLETLVSDSGSCLLITTLGSPHLSDTKVPVLDVSNFLQDWKDVITKWTPSSARPHKRHNQLAYVMYTSGSTGIPKGVCIEHGAILSLVYDRERFQLRPDQRVAQINNLAWDGSVFDVWCTLLQGATLVSFSRYDILEPTNLARLFHRFQVHACFITTSLFRQILNVAPTLFENLDTLLVGGESIDYAQYRKLRGINQNLKLFNMYGPTETCCYTTSYIVPPLEDMPAQGVVPIGRPLGHTQCLIVDKQCQLVPPGIIGELIIGGRGVGAGYLKRPMETSKAFVELTFKKLNQPSATFYRTGDLVKWLPNGELLFIGRQQAGQVKIRGQRLELTEVEAGLVRTGLVSHAAVVYVKPEDGRDAYLTSYIVPKPGCVHETHRQAIFQALKDALPAYMIPRQFRFVEDLPLTNSGKLDRGKIQDWAVAADNEGGDSAEASQTYVAPRNKDEQTLCSIFQSVLSLSGSVGITANFFDAGGHSLLAMRLKWQIESELNVPITIQDIFAAQTPQLLADLIQRLRDTSAASTVLKPMPPGEWQPLSLGQQRMYHITQKVLDPTDGTYNTVAWLRLNGDLDEGVLERSIQEIIRRHETLRSIFVEVEGVPKAKVTEWLPTLAKVDIDPSWDEDQLGDRLRADAKPAFPLAEAPPFRPALYRLRGYKYILMMCMHHIITDGYTHDILFSELSTIYGAFVKGERHPLPPLPRQFASYAQWQMTDEYKNMLEPQFEFWERNLVNQKPAAFPPDFDRPLTAGMIGTSYIVPYPPKLLEKLEALCKAKRVTMFMLLMSVFRVLHFQLTGEQDGSFGSSIANRRIPETLKMCGYFNNIIIYRVAVEKGDTFADVLQRARSVAMDAYANQDAPLRLVSSRIQTPHPGPPIRTMFAYHNFEMTTFPMGSGLVAESFELDMRVNGYQLELYFLRDGDTIKADFHYPPHLYKPSTITWLGEKLTEVLEMTVSNPDFPVVTSEDGWNPPKL